MGIFKDTKKKLNISFLEGGGGGDLGGLVQVKEWTTLNIHLIQNILENNIKQT